MIEEKFSRNLSKILGINDLKRVCICLSGGSDSLSLLFLTKYWTEKHGIEIFVVTVDHKLRKESSIEANEVSIFCKENGFHHSVLTWNHGELKTGIQKHAREARYLLITDFCKQNKIEYAFTGHIFEDQVEQILMSISHGSGIYSYLIPEKNYLKNICFIRPLLDFSKAELKEYLNSKNIRWWIDASNQDTKYFRNKIRPISSQFLQASDPERIRTSIKNIKRISESLNYITDNFLEKELQISDLGYGKINYKKFSELSIEVRFSVLRKILEKIRNKTSNIRLDSIINLDNSIRESISRTLFGCKVILIKEQIYFIREFGKEIIAPITHDGIWDSRFKITNLESYKIDILKEDILNIIIKNDPDILNFDPVLPKNLRKNVLLALPAIFLLENIVSIHHMYINNFSASKVNIELLK